MCPNINSEEVKQQFNEIVLALGGTPLNDVEFRDRATRRLRAGIDASAMDAAYAIWDLNNGNPIDQTPDGSQSELFDWLMSLNGGNRLLAAMSKSAIYSKKWLDLHPGEFSEPTIDEYRSYFDKNPIVEEQSVPLDDTYSNSIIFFGEDRVRLFVDSDNFQSEIRSREVMRNLRKYIPKSQQSIFDAFSLSDVRVEPMRDMIDWMAYDPINQTVRVNLDYLESRSMADNAYAFMHELSHHYLAESYNNPQTATEQSLKTQVDNLYNYYNTNIYRSNDRVQQFAGYALSNQLEFMAFLLTSEAFLRLLSTQPLSRLLRVGNALKRLINTFSRVLTGKEIFNNIVDKGSIDKAFRTAMMVVQDNNKYGIRSYTIPTDLELSELENVDSFLMAIKKKQSRQFVTDTELIQRMNEIDRLHNNIKKGLDSRLNALTRRTAPRRIVINEVKTAIRDVSNADSLRAINDFVFHVRNVMNDAKKVLGRSLDLMSTKDLVMYKTDFEGFYKPMMLEIQDVVDNTNHFDILKTSLRSSDLPIYDDFVALVTLINNEMDRISSRYNNAIKKRTVQIIKEMSNKAGSPTQVVDHILDNLNITDEDVSTLAVYAGMASNLKSDLVRLVDATMRNQINETKRNSLRKGNELKNRWIAARDKYGIDAMKYFREKDSNGKYTGYFVRPLKYGELKADFRAETERLAKKYNLEQDQYGNHVLPAGETPEELQIIQNYNKDVNYWLAENVERKYKPGYYAAMNKMTQNAQEALTEINFNIEKILDTVLDENGVPQFHRLSPSQWANYQQAIRDKAALAIEYDIDGNEKSGIELQIARNIKEVNDEVYKNVTYQKNLDRFNETAERMRRELSPQEYQLWYNRNTREALPEYLQELMNKADRSGQTDLYNQLVDKRRQLLRLVRESDASRTNVDLVTDGMRAAIKDLDEQISYERTPVSRDETDDANSTNFFDLAEIAYIPRYYQEMKEYQSKGAKAYNDWYNANHFENANGYTKPISIWSQLVPKNAQGIADPSLLVRVPTQTWSEVDPSSNWFNPNFDRSSRETYQPKKSKYSNSQQWNDLISKPELKALYDELIATMEESMGKIQFMSNGDPYKLPQISGRTMNILTKRGDLFKSLKWMVKDLGVVKDEDTEFIPEFLRMPNGEYIKHIPTRFISNLEDPNLITSDTVASVISFFEMAENYLNMTGIKDELSTIMYTLENKQFDNGRKVKSGKALNEYKKLEHMLDTNLYGKKKEQLVMNVKFGDKTYKVNVSKAAFKFTNFVRDRNLVGNLWSMAANYITASTGNKLEAIAGRYFDKSSYFKAVKEYARLMPSLTYGLGNIGQKNKLLALCEFNEIARNNEEVFTRLDQSRVLRFLNNHAAYGGYSLGDFAVKSKILLSIYFDNKLVKMPDGTQRYMNRQEFMRTMYPNDAKKGSAAWSVNANHLYNAYSVDKNNNVTVLPQYKLFINTELENRIKNTANFIAARTDGMLTDLDRSKIHTGAITQFLTIHRGFMINGIHDRFKNHQYNYLTGLYEQGLYWGAASGLKRMMTNQKEAGKSFTLWLPQMMSNWLNLQDYEKYAVKKVALEISNILIWTFLISNLLAMSADDDKDDWLVNAAAYISLRSTFEFRSLYNPGEFFSLLKSPSAAVNVADDIGDLLKLVMPSTWTEDVLSGPYKGWKRGLRILTKTTPLKNFFEAQAPRDKRKYLESQLMWN